MSVIKLIEAESVRWLYEQTQEAEPIQYDLIVTDPPYWTLNKWRNMGTTTRLGGHRDKDKQDDSKWFETINRAQLFRVMKNCYSLLKNNSHMYMFCDEEVSDILAAWHKEEKFGFRNCKRLIWDKVDAGMGYHWRATYEFIMMFDKGKRRLNDLGKKDILRHKRVQGKHYPTEKPYSLIEELILNSSNEGDLILDPFFGSGVVGDVCYHNNRDATIVDINPEAFDNAKKRIFSERQAEF